jgi:hypothetical protein
MKQVGRCEYCSRTGVLVTIEVTKVGTTAPVIPLILCSRCATVPNAVWRRRYQPGPTVANSDRPQV